MSANESPVDVVEIAPAVPADVPSVLALLSSVDLPTEGVDAHFTHFVVGRDATGKVVACAGAELHGETALLRSVAVSREMQRTGLGSRLTAAALDVARGHGAREAVLLTTSAADFFSRHHGFEPANRDDFDDRLSTSVEWHLPRCSSAVLLHREL